MNAVTAPTEQASDDRRYREMKTERDVLAVALDSAFAVIQSAYDELHMGTRQNAVNILHTALNDARSTIAVAAN